MSASDASGAAHQSIVDAGALRDLCVAMMQRFGMLTADAEIVADSLVDADLSGFHSHGVIQLPGYLSRLQAGGINPRPQVRVVVEMPALAIVDGDGGMGQVASHFAMELAIRKAREVGTGTVGVRNSEHFGTCSYWARMAVPHGMIGLCTTNGTSCMPAPGGLSGIIGNNPIGLAAPAGREHPFDFDIATSVAAQGKMKMAAARGEPIPSDWAITLEGEPTTDPREGLRGLALPMASYKGFGLGLALEILSALWTGALFGQQIPLDVADDEPQRIGHFFQAIDIAPVMPVGEFARRMDEMIGQIHGSPRMERAEPLRYPGERAGRLRIEQSQKGIPMVDGVLASLRQVADGLGLDWSLG